MTGLVWQVQNLGDARGTILRMRRLDSVNVLGSFIESNHGFDHGVVDRCSGHNSFLS
jgi:hypothetical protein